MCERVRAWLPSQSSAFNSLIRVRVVCRGKRPDSTNVWTFQTNFRASGVDTTGSPGAEWITFPEMFKLHGWNTVGMGKVGHTAVRSPRSLR